MEEYPYAPKQNKSEKPAFLKIRLFKIIFSVIIALLLLLAILNYFNILTISKTFPNQLGWLPRQQTPKNVTPASISFRLCNAFPENYGKVNCHKAVETALADTKGTVTGIAVGPQEISPGLQKALKISKTQTVWLIEIELEKPYFAPNKNLVKSLLVQIPVDGSKAIYRKPINL